MPIVEPLHDVGPAVAAEPVGPAGPAGPVGPVGPVVHAERPAAGLLDVALEFAALESFARLHVAVADDVLNEQGERSRQHECIED